MITILLITLALTLPPADPEQPLFQSSKLTPNFVLRHHPAVREVSWPKPQSPEDMERQLKWEWARLDAEASRNIAAKAQQWISWGTGLIAFGIVITIALKQYGGQAFGLALFGAGVASVFKGAVDLKIASHLTAFSWACCLSIPLFALFYVFKDKGLDSFLGSKIRKRFDSRKNRVNLEEQEPSERSV